MFGILACCLSRICCQGYDDRRLLLQRSGLTDELTTKTQDATVCYHHEKYFVHKYPSLQKSCCDPFEKHPGRKRKGSLKVIDSENAEYLSQQLQKHIRPGQKLCPKCFMDVQKFIEKNSGESADSSVDDPHVTVTSTEATAAINTSLAESGFTPLKSVGTRDKLSYAKRKIKESHESVRLQVASRFDIPVEDVEPGPSDQCHKCKDLDSLIELMKAKLAISSRHEKIKVLTLTPESWTIDKTAAEFNVSKYLVKRARALKKNHGILAEPAKKAGREISTDTKTKITNFYEDDEVSRLCPGKKDCVTVWEGTEKTVKQKRLLLGNLNELYECFKEKHPGAKVGISKFVELRPKWCVTVGSKGSHAVCVCEIHQNVKLMIANILKETYSDLLKKMVCDITSYDCMLKKCDKCPGKNAIITFLKSTFDEMEMDDTDEITYKQWVHTDMTTLITKTDSVFDYIEDLTSKLEDLIFHHFIAKAQAGYLTNCKENLNEEEALVLLDFAENYSFIIQDSVQGQHWNNSQATLHPFAVYYRKDGDTKCQNICVISDHLKHDTITVHAFLSTVIR